MLQLGACPCHHCVTSASNFYNRYSQRASSSCCSPAAENNSFCFIPFFTKGAFTVRGRTQQKAGDDECLRRDRDSHLFYDPLLLKLLLHERNVFLHKSDMKINICWFQSAAVYLPFPHNSTSIPPWRSHLIPYSPP